VTKKFTGGKFARESPAVDGNKCLAATLALSVNLRAMYSLPVPLSPWIMTERLVGATMLIYRPTSPAMLAVAINKDKAMSAVLAYGIPIARSALLRR
jgi:hypothetical protein